MKKFGKIFNMRPLLWAARGFQQLGQAGSGASTRDHTVTGVTGQLDRGHLLSWSGEGRRLFQSLESSPPLSPLLSPRASVKGHTESNAETDETLKLLTPGNDIHVTGNILCLFVGLACGTSPDQGSNPWPPLL